MPDPPSTGFLTRYLFENPWPLALALVIAAVAVGYSALVQGHLKRLPAALLLMASSIGIALSGLLIHTSGEQARDITRQFVEAVAAGDTTLAQGLLAPDATLAFDSPRNPGYDLTFIKSRLTSLTSEYTIDSNLITRLDGYVETTDQGLAYLTCWTEAGYGPVRSQWVIQVTRQTDGSWLISRLNCIRINDQEASRYR